MLCARACGCQARVLCLLLLRPAWSRQFHGAEEWSRTTDTRIFSPLLYHLSYPGSNAILGFRKPTVKRSIAERRSYNLPPP